jgi:hypothetical protein
MIVVDNWHAICFKHTQSIQRAESFNGTEEGIAKIKVKEQPTRGLTYEKNQVR